ncbi:hypothetical protein KSD_61780 [Ktedonobacter sp. SOSP1-85]|uniref:hypothetical protein n=1 Tax=Ktedonobacter sp. SOSP1-85 TaxID=2778367 RepID=UPI001916598A|nr:hypothetical protein [Ktedonobacter sp. SOSP1-85]GHO78407.1 hypothetical protein KSD_61780 [Ktedonobacter sp. SOSP1-85]
MPRLDFFKQKYDESTVLERAKKKAKQDIALQRVIEIVYFDPQVDDADLTQALSNGSGDDINPNDVKLRLRPQAQRLIEQERSKNTSKALAPQDTQTPAPQGQQASEDETITINANVTELPGTSIDSLEAEAVRIVLKAHTGVSLNARMKKWIIFVFKTFAPFAVLCLTIPESIWVFSHIYSKTDQTLEVLTGIFAVLVDFGYLYLTVLLELNKEAIFKRRRAGLEVEDHELKAVRLQEKLWWMVAVMDISAQVVFLYGATKDSTFFTHQVVWALVGIRILSLFITMFVVSFAGTELMTDVDTVANEQVERAAKLQRVMTTLGEARAKQKEARMKLEQMEEDRNLRREGERFLTELYADAREEAKRQREAVRRMRNQGLDDQENGTLR